MNLRPKLFVIWRQLTAKQILSDSVAGIIVGIVALPLAIAFGIASGVSPEKGLITAVIGGFIVSFLGGSRVQIGGPTGAFIVIVYGIVQQYGVDGLMIATIMAGIILVIMGFAQFGSLIKFIPYPVIVGFTAGIAVVIFTSQIKDFFGLNIAKVPADFLEKWYVYFQNIHSVNFQALGIGLLALAIIILFPKITTRIPGSIVAILVTTLIVQYFHLNVETIQSRFGEIPSGIKAPSLPHIDYATVKGLIMPATTIAILAAIEALLSAVVADGMIGNKHRSNMELVAQGVANIASPLFGGIPVTGAIARTATNIKNGGRTPIAGIVHAVTLLIIMLVLGSWAKLIPMTTLAAVLIMVSYNMSEHHIFRQLLKAPKSDIVVLLTTFFLTVVFDLTVAIEIGMILAVILFMQRMSAVANIEVINRELKDADESEDPNAISNKSVPDEVDVYEISGPFFFGAASKFKDAISSVGVTPKIRIIRMRNVPAIDATGLNLLREIIVSSERVGTKVVFSGVHTQPFFAFTQYGLMDLVGEENVLGNIDDALDRAREILGMPKIGRPDSFYSEVKREK